MKRSRRSCCSRALAVMLAASAAGQAWAVHKCVGKNGEVVYQDALCDNAFVTRESVRTWSNSPGRYAVPTGQRTEPSSKLAGPSQAAALLALYRRWADAERLGLATGRIALAGPVASLQAVHRDAESLAVAPCLQVAKAALVDIAGKSVDALLRFMAKDELTGMVYQLTDRSRLMSAFERAVETATCPNDERTAAASLPAPPAATAPAAAGTSGTSPLDAQADACLDWYRPLLRDPRGAYWRDAHLVQGTVNLTVYSTNGFGGYVSKAAACDFKDGSIDAQWTRTQAKRRGW